MSDVSLGAGRTASSCSSSSSFRDAAPPSPLPLAFSAEPWSPDRLPSPAILLPARSVSLGGMALAPGRRDASPGPGGAKAEHGAGERARTGRDPLGSNAAVPVPDTPARCGPSDTKVRVDDEPAVRQALPAVEALKTKLKAFLDLRKRVLGSVAEWEYSDILLGQERSDVFESGMAIGKQITAQGCRIIIDSGLPPIVGWSIWVQVWIEAEAALQQGLPNAQRSVELRSRFLGPDADLLADVLSPNSAPAQRLGAAHCQRVLDSLTETLTRIRERFIKNGFVQVYLDDETEVVVNLFDSTAFPDHAGELIHTSFEVHPPALAVLHWRLLMAMALDGEFEPWSLIDPATPDTHSIGRRAVLKAFLAAPHASLATRRQAVIATTLMDHPDSTPEGSMIAAAFAADLAKGFPGHERGQLLALLMPSILELSQATADDPSMAQRKGEILHHLLPPDSASEQDKQAFIDAYALTCHALDLDDATASACEAALAQRAEHLGLERLERLSALGRTLFSRPVDKDGKDSKDAPSSRAPGTALAPKDWPLAWKTLKAIAAPEAALLLDSITAAPPDGKAAGAGRGAQLDAVVDILHAGTTLLRVDALRRTREWLLDLLVLPGPWRERLRAGLGSPSGAKPAAPLASDDKHWAQAFAALGAVYEAPAALLLQEDSPAYREAVLQSWPQALLQERRQFLASDLRSISNLRATLALGQGDKPPETVAHLLELMEMACRRSLEAIGPGAPASGQLPLPTASSGAGEGEGSPG